MGSADFTVTHGWTRSHGYEVIDLPVAGFYRQIVSEHVPAHLEPAVETIDTLFGTFDLPVERFVAAHTVTRTEERVEGRDDSETQAIFRYLNRYEVVDQALWDRLWEKYRAAERRAAAQQRWWNEKMRGFGLTPSKLPQPKRPRRSPATHQLMALVYERYLADGLQVCVVMGVTGKLRVVSTTWERAWVLYDDKFNVVRFAMRPFEGAKRAWVRVPLEKLSFDDDSVDDAMEAADAWASRLADEDSVGFEMSTDPTTLVQMLDHRMAEGRA